MIYQVTVSLLGKLRRKLDRPNVISTNFTQRELYYLTQKNSKTPYPYDFDDWRSHRRPTTDASSRQAPIPDWQNYASKCVVCLRPKDLAEKISDGVFAPNSFQIRVNGVARDGTHSYGVDTAQNYRMYIHLFFGRHFLRIEPWLKIWLFIAVLWGLWCVKALLTCLVQGTSLEIYLPLIHKNMYNSYRENL